MPFIDVDDLLLDPEIAGQSFTVTRSTTSASNQGLTQPGTPAVIAALGSVQPATSNELQRMPDLERISGAITVRTPFALIAGGKDPVTGLDRTADIVTWKGVQYTVESVQDYSDFGGGYVEALCSRIDLR